MTGPPAILYVVLDSALPTVRDEVDGGYGIRGSALPRNRPFEALVPRLQHAQTRAAVGGAVTATPTIPTIASTDSVIDALH